MKKMLLLVGMLAVSGLAFAKNGEEEIIPNPGFGAEFGVANATKEESIEVKARVIAPLTIQNVQNVDFGIIVKGKEGKAYPDKEGGFEVKGEPNQTIAIYVKDDDGTYEKAASPEAIYNVALVKVGGSSANENEKIDALMNVLPEGESYGAKNMTLSKDGLKRFSVSGNTKPATMDHEIGEYKGYLHVKAQYE